MPLSWYATRGSFFISDYLTTPFNLLFSSVDLLIVQRVQSSKEELAHLKSNCDKIALSLQHKQDEQHSLRQQRHSQLFARQALDTATLECQRLKDQERDLLVEQRRLHAQIHWAMARRMMRTRSQEDSAADESRLRRRQRLRMELLRSLPQDAATSPPALMATLATRRAALQAAIAAEPRFVALADHEQLAARQAALQAEATRLAARVQLAQLMAGRLRILRAVLMSRGDDPGASDLRARAAAALEAVARFESSFATGNYAAAAMIAAQSPEAVLRTPATWARFSAGRSPDRWTRRRESRPAGPASTPPPTLLLLYCNALVQAQPSVAESLACVQCAVECEQWDRIAFWLAQVTDILVVML